MPSLLSAKGFALSSAVPAALAPSFAAAQDNNIECPGVLNNSDDGNYCCVGGSLTLSVCAGWPICTGPTTIDEATQTLSCITKVPITQSDYSAVIASYASNGVITASDARTTATSTGAESTSSATTSEQDSENETRASATTAATSERSSESSSSGAASSSSAGAADRVTGPIGAVAGGLLGLAALL